MIHRLDTGLHKNVQFTYSKTHIIKHTVHIIEILFVGIVPSRSRPTSDVGDSLVGHCDPGIARLARQATPNTGRSNSAHETKPTPDINLARINYGRQTITVHNHATHAIKPARTISRRHWSRIASDIPVPSVDVTTTPLGCRGRSRNSGVSGALVRRRHQSGTERTCADQMKAASQVYGSHGTAGRVVPLA